MFSPFERMVAFRYLRSRRREGFISIIAWFSLLGILLGVGTLIVVMSVMNGFRAELLNGILGLNGHVIAYARTPAGIPDFDALAKTVAQQPGVTSVTAIIEGQVMATAQGQASGAIVRGVRAADLPAAVKASVGGDRLKDFTGDDVVLLGDRLADKLGLQAGGKITLISPKGNATAFGTAPRLRTYRVVGTFNVGMFQIDSSYVYMPLEAAQLYFSMPDKVTELQVTVTDPDKARDAALEIAKATQGQLRVFDWQQLYSSMFNAVVVERNVMFLILTLIIVVAAFNIISSLIMLVKDKGRDIAILRTMGATRGMIMRIFFLDGATIGVIGTLGGVAAGVAFAANITPIFNFVQSVTGMTLFAPEVYFLSTLPAKIETSDVVTVTIMSLVLSFLATIYPSWRAARLDPVEALRYE